MQNDYSCDCLIRFKISDRLRNYNVQSVPIFYKLSVIIFLLWLVCKVCVIPHLYYDMLNSHII